MSSKRIISTMLLTLILLVNIRLNNTALATDLDLSNSLGLSNDLGSETIISNDENGIIKLITKRNKQIKEYQSVASLSAKNIDTHPGPNNPEHHFTATIDARFIEDQHSNEMTTLINLKGFIAAEKEIPKSKYFPNNPESQYRHTSVHFPIKYSVAFTNLSYNSGVTIVDSIPKNKINTSTISKTLGYEVGGKVSLSAAKNSGNITAGLENKYIDSLNINYIQPDFSTLQKEHSTKQVSWDTTFTQTKDGYDLQSSNPVYGNQLFMKSRYGSTSALQNLIPDYKLSQLMTSGFSPDMGVILKAPDNTNDSIIQVKLERERATYHLQWVTTQWEGKVRSDEYDTNMPYLESHTFKFKIDWKNKKVYPLT